MNLIAIVDKTEEIIKTMWGDPNHWMDLQRRIYKVFITLSVRDQRAGYSLQRLDLYENSINPGAGTIEKRGVNPLGLTIDSVIQIRGPLYRADAFGFANHELTEEEKPAFALPFRGYSGPRTRPIKDSRDRDRRKHLAPLSIKTAEHAIGYLPEHPIALPSPPPVTPWESQSRSLWQSKDRKPCVARTSARAGARLPSENPGREHPRPRL